MTNKKDDHHPERALLFFIARDRRHRIRFGDDLGGRQRRGKLNRLRFARFDRNRAVGRIARRTRRLRPRCRHALKLRPLLRAEEYRRRMAEGLLADEPADRPFQARSLIDDDRAEADPGVFQLAIHEYAARRLRRDRHSLGHRGHQPAIRPHAEQRHVQLPGGSIGRHGRHLNA
ncbi:hypothetical protein [Cohnella ginsengisoli]|uniref:hypothetical protein n=1 Tax=Cohnella ginsengisoli TaxID=425004 RepID=UPI0030B8B75A